MLTKSLPAVVIFAALFVFAVDSQPPDAVPASSIPYYGSWCVLPKTYGDFSACCGSRVYNYSDSICCNGVVSPTCENPYTCCDQVPYDYTQYVCCYPSMIIKYKKYGDYTSCCGSTVYDYSTQSCCYDTVIDPKKQLCCGSGSVITIPASLASVTTVACCGKTVYNWQTQLCCDGIVRPKTYGATSTCCGTTVINWQTQGCCYSYTYDAQGNWLSTTTKIYNTATQFCCNGVVMPATYGTWSWCCGSSVYNYSSSLCCNNNLIVNKPYGDYTTCCGSSAINYQTTGCCYDYYNTPMTQTTYNYNSQMCCYGSVKDKLFGDRSACCETVVYDTSCNMCCNGVLHCLSSYDGYNYCCGNKLYDWRTQICCYNC